MAANNQQLIATTAILKNIKGETLFLLRNFKPFGYGLPGGKVENSDTSIKNACIREIYEETGLSILENYLVYLKSENSVNNNVLVHIFEYKKPINESEIVISQEHADYTFTKYPDELEYLAGNTKKFIETQINMNRFRAFDDGIMYHSHNPYKDFDTEIETLRWFFNIIRDDAIIMKSTGLFDKKDVEIFEGDIVNDGLGEIFYCIDSAMFKIRWHDKTYKSVRGNMQHYQNGEPLMPNTNIVFEVVGNIYENSNLIKI